MATLVCPSCERRAPADSLAPTCECGELFDVVHRLRPVEPARWRSRGAHRATDDPSDHSGVWRFRELVYPAFPTQAVVSLWEGNTPLYRSAALGEYTGLPELRIKHEGMNPTGSFKDRGMTVAVSRAVASGGTLLACASTGNTSASLAAYAAAAAGTAAASPDGRPRIRALVLAPEGATAPSKLAQAVAYGARTVLVRGDFDRALELVRELVLEGDANGESTAQGDRVALLNSVNPFRLEGQKSIVFELLDQLDWDPPEWFCFPAGNLGNCAAFGKALAEAVQVGLIDRLPRLVAVQASGSAPFAQAFANGFGELQPVRAETVATAIRIGNPASYRRAIRSIRSTGGLVIDVSDADLLEAKAVVDRAGIGAEPASATSVAGARKLARAGVIPATDRVVALLTGHLMKDAKTTLAYHGHQILGVDAQRANPPVVIEPTRKELLAALRP